MFAAGQVLPDKEGSWAATIKSKREGFDQQGGRSSASSDAQLLDLFISIDYW